MSDLKLRALADRLVRHLADNGQLIEAGWQAYRLLCLKVPPHQPRDDLHEAFRAGAEHIFACVIQMLEPGDEPTPNDLLRMERLNEELEPIRRELRLKYGRTAGSA